jgi:DNA-binding NtrC family response regulator
MKGALPGLRVGLTRLRVPATLEWSLHSATDMDFQRTNGSRALAAPSLEPATERLFLELVRHADAGTGTGPLRLRDWVELAEAWRITQALRESRGNRSAAARALGIGRRTLYSKMEKLGITERWGLPHLDATS